MLRRNGNTCYPISAENSPALIATLSRLRHSTRAKKSALRVAEHSLLPDPIADERDYEHGDDRDAADQPIFVDCLCGCLAELICDHADDRPPDDSAERIPEEEAPPRHLANPCKPRRRDPQKRDEPPEEHRLRPVAGEEALRGRQGPLERVADDRRPGEQRASPLPPDP